MPETQERADEVGGDEATAQEGRLSGGRALAVWVLIVLGTLVGLAAGTNAWLQREALDTDNFVNASDQLLSNDEIREAVSEYLVNEFYANVDVKADLADRLPDNLQGLAGPVATWLREPATRAVDQLMASDAFRAAWNTAIRDAHTVLVAVLEDDSDVISSTNGVVTLNLGDLVVKLGEELGVSDQVLSNIPDDAGSIVIVQSRQLDELQTAVKTIEWVSALALFVILALYLAAVLVAVGARRLTIRNIGWSIFVLGLILLVFRRAGIDYLVDELDNPDYQPAARAAYGIASELLGRIGWGAIFFGLLVVLTASLLGPTRPARRIRQVISPAFNASPWLVWGGAVVVFLLLVAWSPTPAFDTWYLVLILAALFGSAVGALRWLTMREFPDTTFADVGASFSSKEKETQ